MRAGLTKLLIVADAVKLIDSAGIDRFIVRRLASNAPRRLAPCRGGAAEKAFAAFSIWRTASSHRRPSGRRLDRSFQRFGPPPAGELSAPRSQVLSKASIAARAVMWALAGFAPVTTRPLVTENASNGDGGAT
jgi:hypothetical protein